MDKQLIKYLVEKMKLGYLSKRSVQQQISRFKKEGLDDKIINYEAAFDLYNFYEKREDLLQKGLQDFI